MKKHKFLSGNILSILILIVSIFLGIQLTLLYQTISPLILSGTSVIKNNVNCNDTDIINASYCLRDQLNLWYNYNMSNVNIKMSADELKKQGGVCWQYSEWYLNEMKSRGFLAYSYAFWKNSTVRHQITIASDNTAYCILDQTEVRCIKWS
jgi:hypothetical protein